MFSDVFKSSVVITSVFCYVFKSSVVITSVFCYVFKSSVVIVTNLFGPYIILLLLQFLVCMRWGDRRMIGAAGTQVCEVIWK